MTTQLTRPPTGSQILRLQRKRGGHVSTGPSHSVEINRLGGWLEPRQENLVVEPVARRGLRIVFGPGVVKPRAGAAVLLRRATENARVERPWVAAAYTPHSRRVELAAAKRIATEGVATERVAAKRIATERVAAERVAAERVAAERVAAERIAAQRVPTEGVTAERVATEGVAPERIAAQRIA